MKNIKQMKTGSSAALRLSDYSFGSNYAEACLRFFKSAEMLPDETSLGLQIRFAKDTVPTVTVFSDAELSLKDYEWMFRPCAEVTEQKDMDAVPSVAHRTYSIAEGASPFTEKSFGESDLIGELSALDAVLIIIVPSDAANAAVLLQTADEIPLRVRVILSNAFHGAEIKRQSESYGKEEKGLPCDTVSGPLKNLLSAIAEKNDSIHPPTLIVLDEDESDTGIEALDLSVRAYNCLKRAGIDTVEKLRNTGKEELMKVRNLGRKAYEEVLEKLRAYGPAPEFAAETEPDDEPCGQEMLDGLIGLDAVKCQVKRIAALARMQEDMKERGIAAKPVTLNMSFIGNPGTAKTTVARIAARILYESGILKKSQVTEVGRADLVGRYEGQTAANVREIFREAKDGMLFIDEAYSLVEDWHNAYGDEAINTIVQEMENHRSDTVVVFAGYPGPMEDFLSRNPGLRSRVPFRIEFADYSPEEMLRIAVLESGRRGFSISPDAAGKMLGIFAEAQKSAENGNGRFCRNLIENAVLSYAERVYGNGADASEKDFVLRANDFSDIGIKKTEPKKTCIGF